MALHSKLKHGEWLDIRGPDFEARIHATDARLKHGRPVPIAGTGGTIMLVKGNPHTLHRGGQVTLRLDLAPRYRVRRSGGASP